MLQLKAGTTSRRQRFKVLDSSSTTGAGLAGLTNASGGLIAYFIRDGDAAMTAISLAAGTVGTWSSGGFKEVDAAHAPGLYELGIPNAALASGSTEVIIELNGAANMVPVTLFIQLEVVDRQDAAGFGLSRLDAAVSTRSTLGGTAQTGDAYARLGAPAGASIAADLAEIEGETDAIQTTLAAGMTLTAQERLDTADALLKRDWTLVSGTPPARSLWNALRLLRNAWTVASGVLKVAKEDDDLGSPAWTATVTSDSAAAPVTGTDPT